MLRGSILELWSNMSFVYTDRIFCGQPYHRPHFLRSVQPYHQPHFSRSVVSPTTDRIFPGQCSPTTNRIFAVGGQPYTPTAFFAVSAALPPTAFFPVGAALPPTAFATVPHFASEQESNSSTQLLLTAYSVALNFPQCLANRRIERYPCVHRLFALESLSVNDVHKVGGFGKHKHGIRDLSWGLPLRCLSILRQA